MATMNYGAVRMLVSVESSQVRWGLRNAFTRAGVGTVHEAGTKEQLYRTLSEVELDLIVMTSDLQGDFVGQLIGQMRCGQLGVHPFAVTVMMLPMAERALLARAIDCGPDDLLLMPVAPGQILARIESLAHSRKPFMVSQDYTGPDRRSEKKLTAEEVTLVDVPNPLRARTTNTPVAQLNAEIAKAAVRLNVVTLERYLIQLYWLYANMKKALSGPEVDEPALRSHAIRVQQVAEDIIVRLPDPTGTVASLANAVAASGSTIFDEGARTTTSTLDGLSAACARLAKEIKQRI